MKRSGKFYRKNEAYVMRAIGFEPTPNSGSGWIFKEDGQTENTIAQLKSTDAASIRLNLFDIQKLEANALTAHKKPVFVIQFLKDNSVYLIVRPEPEILEAIHKTQYGNESVEVGDYNVGQIEILSSSPKNRESFHRNKEQESLKREKEWKEAQKELRKTRNKKEKE